MQETSGAQDYDQYLKQKNTNEADEDVISDFDIGETNGPIRISENLILGQYKSNNR